MWEQAPRRVVFAHSLSVCVLGSEPCQHLPVLKERTVNEFNNVRFMFM